MGRVDSLSSLLPDTRLFLYSYVRKEAVLSSQIEGTQSSLSDLLLFELEEAPGVPLDRGRGSEQDPGQFRRTQNWVGGSRPGNAAFVPPPPQAVADCMSDLERFLHAGSDGIPVLIRAALAHVQFETIHPFLDGNGRIGRLLVTFLLCQEQVLREPLLYLSLFLKQNRDEYYRLLDQVRKEGDREAWVQFFLEGVRLTAESAVSTARRLAALFREDQARVQDTGRVAGSALRVHEALEERSIASLQDISRRAALSFPAASTGMSVLERAGIAKELTGKKRNRVFGYARYLAILSEGTEV